MRSAEGRRFPATGPTILVYERPDPSSPAMSARLVSQLLAGLAVAPDAATTFGSAWLAAVAALALHVADEATHDFLAWYNPSARRIRQALRGFPFPPTFTFVPWLAGLVAGIVLLGVLTPWAYRGTPWMRPLAFALAVIHIGNGLLHLAGSVLAGRRVPGVLSAPFLLLAGGWLAYAAARLG